MKYRYRGGFLEAGPGSTYLALAKKVGNDYPAPVILAKVGQDLVELNKTVPEETFIPGTGSEAPEISFITTADSDGHRTYERGATMMFLRAMAHRFGKRIEKLKLEYAIGDGLFFSVKLRGGEALTDGDLGEVRATMERYVREDEKFEKSKIPTREAMELFHHHGMTDKEGLFHYRLSSSTNVYRLGNYVDYYYGYMPPSAGYISVFDLRLYEDGVILTIPNRKAPLSPGSPAVAKKLFGTRRDSTVWGENIGVPTVAALNDALTRGEGRDIILASEAYQEHNVGQIAWKIKNGGRRIVMIAGPSSSGKTSFSHRLSVQLNNAGLKAHPIACDNYYVERSKTPRDENGEYDFECLEAIDIELFNEQMTSLLKGEAVDLPVFNFKTGVPEFPGDPLRIGRDDVLVIEGIHGLNDKLSYAVPKDDKFKIFVSAETALNIDEHNRIATTDNREIRRMVRDARTRGFSAKETISRWASVRHGEQKHIYPFEEQADVMFNSATLYELAVLKTFAEPLLFSITPDMEEYPEAKRLLKFLSYFLGLSCEDVPRNSLIREFIGGSVFPVG